MEAKSDFGKHAGEEETGRKNRNKALALRKISRLVRGGRGDER